MAADVATEKPWAVTPEKIAEAVARLVEAGTPQPVIAFGSAATGDLTAANDLDRLVIQPQVANRVQETVRLRQVWRGLLMTIRSIGISKERYDDRSKVPYTVEFAARTRIAFLMWPAEQVTCPPSPNRWWKRQPSAGSPNWATPPATAPQGRDVLPQGRPRPSTTPCPDSPSSTPRR